MSLQQVLLVDDEPDIRALVSLILQRLGGFTVCAASSGQEALALLRDGYLPDIILLDVMMPGMDGVQTLAEMRAMPTIEKLAICFLTAKIQPADIAQWRALGVDEVLTKPFIPAKLVDQVRSCWENVKRDRP
ncbi:response regulator [Paraperlucidibaca wandonensis]|jgi:two-component system OmpR family response regulator|uniref:Response regulator n=1 Tax=Paraperlucidibaca wandonensis TaxID=1268273 RepID=A0ABW3HJG7_9GAMM|nr:response regulator [Paraperlucidibaca sp.]MBQ0721990.1 response regulator [Paraperlucidibaca sp.]MBQ0841514.1 response regulator [Paraperlucidibaca sp.]|tara:strand:+ start:117 stop:512 length:396 start_codon:yes stop_codon:yes gene_type:complete